MLLENMYKIYKKPGAPPALPGWPPALPAVAPLQACLRCPPDAERMVRRAWHVAHGAARSGEAARRGVHAAA